MNKSELIQQLAAVKGTDEKVATKVVQTILETMTSTLTTGDRVEIRDFGTLTVRAYPGYRGRNPKTGEKISVAPKKLPFFKVGKNLREQVNERK